MLEMFYVNHIEPGNPQKATFVLQTNEQIEMLRESGLNATFPAAGNLSKLIKHVLQRRPLSVEFLKDPSLALYFSYYT